MRSRSALENQMAHPTKDDVQTLVRELERGGTAWVNGRVERFGTAQMVQAPDMTIFGPFGGAASGSPARAGRAGSGP